MISLTMQFWKRVQKAANILKLALNSFSKLAFKLLSGGNYFQIFFCRSFTHVVRFAINEILLKAYNETIFSFFVNSGWIN